MCCIIIIIISNQFSHNISALKHSFLKVIPLTPPSHWTVVLPGSSLLRYTIPNNPGVFH